jgi:serine/threonine protein kinase
LISLRSDDPYEFAARSNNESWLIEANQLSLEQAKILGQGCYGEVVKAVLTKWWGSETEVVAVKRINPNVPIDSGLRDMRHEIEIMKKLSHRHIVEIKGFVEDPQLMLVMEYMELGSLLSYLRVHKHRMMQDVIIPLKKFALDVMDGMEYLESKKIVHRDLAARNILVANENEVKISDFGLAHVIKEGDYYRMRTQQCLPLRWYAPESIMRCTFTHKSDVWSAGVVLWEMYSYGKDVVYPEVEHDYDLLQRLEDGIRLECPENCPLEVYKIMLSCWKKSPDQRPSFQDLQTQIIALND